MMTESELQHSRIAAVLPSLTDVMFLLPLAFMFGRAKGAQDLLEGDTGWHIRAGEWMLAHGQVARTDMFSFTKDGQPWFAWEWLWEVGAAGLHRHGGLAAVVMASMLVLCLTSVLLFRLVLRVCPYRTPAAAITFLAVASSSVHWWARPHILSWLFAVMTMWVVAWQESGERRWLWTLPLLTIAWANIHGGFLVVFIILGSYAAGHLLRGGISYLRDQGAQPATSAVPYVLTGIGCALASLVNPYGLDLYRHLFSFLSGDKVPLDGISEWQSLSFHNPMAPFIELMIVGAVAGAVYCFRTGRHGQGLLVLGWLHMALVTVRHIPIFVFIAAPAIGEALAAATRTDFATGASSRLGRLLAAIGQFERDFSAIDRLPRVYLASALPFAFVVWAALLPVPVAKLEASFPDDRYPVKAITALSAKAFEGSRVFTPDEWGDYLIYRLTPKTKVYIDGRIDFYGAKHMEDYFGILGCKYDWEKRLSHHRIDRVLVPVNHCLATTIKESLNWSVVYDDGMSIFFRRREGNSGQDVSKGASPARS